MDWAIYPSTTMVLISCSWNLPRFIYKSKRRLFPFYGLCDGGRSRLRCPCFIVDYSLQLKWISIQHINMDALITHIIPSSPAQYPCHQTTGTSLFINETELIKYLLLTSAVKCWATQLKEEDRPLKFSLVKSMERYSYSCLWARRKD